MRRGEKGTTERGKRSLSEFIKYQGNIAGTGSVSRAGALVPLITTDKKPGAEEGEQGGGGRGGGEGGGSGGGGESSARDSGPDYGRRSKRCRGGFRGAEGKNAPQTNWVYRYAGVM